MKTTRAWIIIVLMLVFLGGKASAYCIIGDNISCPGCPQSGTGWPGDTATFHSNGFSGSNSTFDSAFADALNSWNNLSGFSYSSISASVDPCGGPDDTRGWKFDSTNCGTPFGSTVLALTSTWADSFCPSINNIIDADIVFNTAQTWDVHNGPDSPGGPKDFRRVAVHELGHALGLGHDDTSPAIMNTFYSQTIETPQPDDINGLKALHSGSASASPSPDIKANGSDGPVTPIENLSVTIALDPGSQTGEDADWWLVVNTPTGEWEYFDLTSGTYTSGLMPTLQGFSLVGFGSTVILNTSGLGAGTYTYYFALDLGTGQLYFDSVTVNIVADASGSCTSNTIWECFDETDYQTPVQTDSPTDNFCKSWSSSGFTCSGSFYIAVYPPVGNIPTQYTFGTSCSDAQIKTLTGMEIDNLLQTLSSAALQNLSAHELEEGKVPVMLQATFSGGGSGTVSVDVYCQ